MTLGTWLSFQDKKAKLPTQSAEKWSCMGKLEFKILADFFFSKTRRSQTTGVFLVDTLPNCRKKRNQKESSMRGKVKIDVLSQKIPISAKMTIVWPLTPPFGLGQTSISLPILVH